jgi:hypothetical protein
VRYFGQRDSLPSINAWLRDWSSQCARPPPPHVWTPDHDADLPRLTSLLTARLSLKPTALLRDRSNRLAGVMFGGLFVPCLDDGNLAVRMPRLFEADAIPDTPIDEYVRFYAELRIPIVAQLARMGESSAVVGFLTATGTMVPCGPGSSDLPVQQVDAFPWERDAEIMRAADALGSAAVLEEQKASVEEQAAEAYQYLRLSMGRYLNYDAAGQGVKEAIMDLMGSTKPLYVKRQKLDILLEPVIRTFLEVVVTERRAALPLLRSDCIPLGEEACRTGCAWVQDSCKIAVPQRGSIDTVRVFTARLSDEFLRYPSRAEIFEDRVAKIRAPKGAVRVGDELVMTTKKKEPVDLILERLGFTGLRPAAFPEEMLRLEAIEETVDGPPASWAERGFRVIEEDRNVVLAAVMQTPIETLATNIESRKAKLGLPATAFAWSLQDMYALASIKLSTVVLVAPEGTTVIRPPKSNVPAPELYMIFWGDLLVSRGDKYRFGPGELPEDLAMTIEATSPLSIEELGITIATAPPVETVAVASAEE